MPEYSFKSLSCETSITLVSWANIFLFLWHSLQNLGLYKMFQKVQHLDLIVQLSFTKHYYIIPKLQSMLITIYSNNVGACLVSSTKGRKIHVLAVEVESPGDTETAIVKCLFFYPACSFYEVVALSIPVLKHRAMPLSMEASISVFLLLHLQQKSKTALVVDYTAATRLLVRCNRLYTVCQLGSASCRERVASPL